MMLLHVLHHTIPAAYALLPEAMRTREATAMLLAIGLQESLFEYRRQTPTGPARGFYQFEQAGVRGVLTHPTTQPHIDRVLSALKYAGATTTECWQAIEHNDVLATCFARLLLWTIPARLPDQHYYEQGYAQYIAAWRPGKPRPQEWPGNFGIGWDLVSP